MSASVPNLGEFVVETPCHRVKIQTRHGDMPTDVLAVKRGSQTYTVHMRLEPGESALLLVQPGDTVRIAGILLGEVILTNHGRVHRVPKPGPRAPVSAWN